MTLKEQSKLPSDIENRKSTMTDLTEGTVNVENLSIQA